MLANFARFPSSSPTPPPQRPNIPRRTDSLNKIIPRSASPSAAHQKLASTNALPPIFAAVEDELRDARRVGTHGQEEDLRAALGNVIGRVEELSTLLKEAYRTTAELETSLGLARSNLTLVQSNNDMLEEALKRGDAGMAGGSKDVGWRRWSAREGEKLASTPRIEEERPRSLDYGSLKGQSTNGPHPNGPPTASTSSPSPLSASPLSSPSVIPATPATGQDSRFFRGFRFSNGNGTASGSSTPAGRSSRSPTRSPGGSSSTTNGPLTSPSMPSLHSNSHPNQEIAEMQQILDVLQARVSELEKELEGTKTALGKEKEGREKAVNEKIALEGEIESLSQALFEEANKMVAHERIKRAETEDELREARLEKDALKSALRVVEGENGRLRTSSSASASAAAKAVEVADGEENVEERRKAIDLDADHEVETRRRSAMDESRHAATHAEVDGEPISRSSSRMATKSPVSTSRTSSESVVNMLTEPTLAPLPPSPTLSPSRSPSLDEYSTPAQSRSQTLEAETEPKHMHEHEQSQSPLEELPSSSAPYFAGGLPDEASPWA